MNVSILNMGGSKQQSKQQNKQQSKQLRTRFFLAGVLSVDPSGMISFIFSGRPYRHGDPGGPGSPRGPNLPGSPFGPEEPLEPGTPWGWIEDAVDRADMVVKVYKHFP